MSKTDNKTLFLCVSSRRDIDLIYLCLNKALMDFRFPFSEESQKRIKKLTELIEDLIYE